jgi:hypothetical protein
MRDENMANANAIDAMIRSLGPISNPVLFKWLRSFPYSRAASSSKVAVGKLARKAFNSTILDAWWTGLAIRSKARRARS